MCTTSRDLTPGAIYHVCVGDVGFRLHVVFPCEQQLPPEAVPRLEALLIDAVASTLASHLPTRYPATVFPPRSRKDIRGNDAGSSDEVLPQGVRETPAR